MIKNECITPKMYYPGIPDICIISDKSYSLFIEIKSPKIKNIKLSFKQAEVNKLLESLGQRFVLSNNFEEIKQEIEDFFVRC